MSKMMSGMIIVANPETRMVLDGRITFWSDGKSSSRMIVENPRNGFRKDMDMDLGIGLEMMNLLEEACHSVPMSESSQRGSVS